MIILISPAKSLDFESPSPVDTISEIPFPEKTEALVSALNRFSGPKLKTIMPVSDALIELNRKRYKNFFEQSEKQAIFAYNGDVYTGFDAKTIDEPALDYAQNHLRILSGLYGLLRPLDPIRPHRLEMGTRWAPRRKKLTDFWGDAPAKAVQQSAEEAGSKAIINLASQEYFAAIEAGRKHITLPVITMDFRQNGPNGPKFQSFAAKRARGLMARYICDNRLVEPEDIKNFDIDGYAFDADNSDQHSWRFIRT
ncbi:peroxide stress protein YaaA [Parasphingorhabdus sp. DH2-15]|uniref:peroxide stress protein YaaA n=1 Tax=Parasphingorhabdus sp. DH2-15 TaxID=3444112 RepID=UPI003F683BE8